MNLTHPAREEELNILIRAKYPILYIVAWEERRIEQILRQAAGQLRKKLYGEGLKISRSKLLHSAAQPYLLRQNKGEGIPG